MSHIWVRQQTETNFSRDCNVFQRQHSRRINFVRKERINSCMLVLDLYKYHPVAWNIQLKMNFSFFPLVFLLCWWSSFLSSAWTDLPSHPCFPQELNGKWGQTGPRPVDIHNQLLSLFYWGLSIPQRRANVYVHQRVDNRGPLNCLSWHWKLLFDMAHSLSDRPNDILQRTDGDTLRSLFPDKSTKKRPKTLFAWRCDDVWKLSILSSWAWG